MDCLMHLPQQNHQTKSKNRGKLNFRGKLRWIFRNPLSLKMRMPRPVRNPKRNPRRRNPKHLNKRRLRNPKLPLNWNPKNPILSRRQSTLPKWLNLIFWILKPVQNLKRNPKRTSPSHRRRFLSTVQNLLHLKRKRRNQLKSRKLSRKIQSLGNCHLIVQKHPNRMLLVLMPAPNPRRNLKRRNPKRPHRRQLNLKQPKPPSSKKFRQIHQNPSEIRQIYLKMLTLTLSQQNLKRNPSRIDPKLHHKRQLKLLNYLSMMTSHVITLRRLLSTLMKNLQPLQKQLNPHLELLNWQKRLHLSRKGNPRRKSPSQLCRLLSKRKKQSILSHRLTLQK